MRTRLPGKLIICLLRSARAVADMIIIYASFYLGYHIYFLNVPDIAAIYCKELYPTLYYLPTPEYSYFTIAFGVALSTFLVYTYLGLYRDDTSILHVREYRNVFLGFISAALLFLALYYISFAYIGEGTRDKLFSRRIFGYASVLSIVGIMLARAGFNKIQNHLHCKGIGARRILIYGAGNTGKLVARRLREFSAFGMLPVAMIDDNPSLSSTEVVYDAAYSASLPVCGTGEQLKKHMTAMHAHELLVAIPTASRDTALHIVNICIQEKIPFRFVPNVYQFALEKTIVNDIAGIPMISVRQTSERFIYLMSKRIFDILSSILALLLLTPIMLFIALVIRVDSNGFPLFIQTRIGLNGTPFKMFKFRTMYINAEKYAVNPHGQDDPRITRVGRWLRRLSLDELPQLINVLTGSMSMVGPRPEMPFIVDQYNDVHKERLKVKPGITGLWQISANRKLPIHENMDYDLYYVHEQSFLLDMVIIVQTFFFAFKGI